MSVHLQVESAFLRRGRPAFRAIRNALAVSALAAALAGCAAPPSPWTAVPDPSDPAARVPAVGYRSTLGPYTSGRPVEPASWRELNERVAPQPRQ